MSITREQFDKLVREVEQGLGGRPSELQKRVLWLAAIGYAALLAGLLGVLALAAVFITPAFWVEWPDAIWLWIIGLVILFLGCDAVLKALWVRLEPPKGLPVVRGEATVLFAELDELQRQLRSAPFDQVLVVPECNAAVVQHPRLGVFGWPRNFLLIGLPLLEGLSADEMRAVLAHEFAHLSRRHGSLGQRVYCLRRSWETVFEQMSKSQVKGELSLRPLYAKFLDWFWPRFNAHAFVLSRANEFQADRDAARLGGVAHAASSLLWIRLADRWYDSHFWPGLWKRAAAEAEPPADAFVRVRELLRAGFSAEETVLWTEQAFRQQTTNADTHPCLTERLRAMGREVPGAPDPPAPSPAKAVAVSAGETWFGERLPVIRDGVGRVWAAAVRETWAQHHARAGGLQHRLDRLNQAVPAPDSNVDALWDKARVVLELEGGKEAQPLLRQILALDPKHCVAHFHLGRLLLEESNPEGVAHLEVVMERDDESVPAASQILHAHYWRIGDTGRIRELDARLDRYEANLQASRAERNTIHTGDPLIPHDLTPSELDALRGVMEAESDLVAADLGRKELKHYPNEKLFLLCAQARPSWHHIPNRDREQGLIRRLSAKIQLPGRVRVFTPRGEFRKLAGRIAALPGAAVFRRTR